jgi:hypothetical protein
MTVTELLLGHVVNAMHISWKDVCDMLQSFPLIITLHLSGIPYADIPDSIPTKIHFAHI